MEKQEFFIESSDGITQLHGIAWIPGGEVRAVLQISHGMDEYVGRYDRFATYLAEQGFFVVGNDHLGHGDSITEMDQLGYFGEPDGNEHLIADLHQIREKTQEEQSAGRMAGEEAGKD